MDKKGFTLIELIITVAIITIITSIALPNFIRLLENEKLRLSARMFNSNFNLARMSAMRHRANVEINFNAQGDGYTIELQDPLAVTSNSLPIEINLDASLEMIEFETIQIESRGYPFQQYAFKIKTKDKEKELIISRTGKVDVR